MIKKLGIVVFSLSLLLLVVQPAHADPEKIYQIEIIIYRHLDRAGLNEEQWPLLTPIDWSNSKRIELSQTTDDSSQPDSNNPIDTQQAADVNLTTTIPMNTLLSPKFFILQKEQAALNRYADQILLHIAWRESESTLKNTHTLHFVGGDQYDSHSRVLINTDVKTISLIQKQYQLDGDLTIRLDRYFNLKFNLLFAEPTKELDGLLGRHYFSSRSNNPLFYFRLQQNRRMKSRELNYIDHPLYGVLVKIIKV